MVLKLKNLTPQEYIQVGIAFFLLGMALSTLADGRLFGVFFTNLNPDGTIMHTVQEFARGFSLPISMASIYFNVRGLVLMRQDNLR